MLKCLRAVAIMDAAEQLIGMASRARTVQHVLLTLPVIDEVCELGVLTDSSSSSFDLTTDPTEEELALARAAFERDYVFHSTDTRHPKQAPFFKEVVLKHWCPIVRISAQCLSETDGTTSAG